MNLERFEPFSYHSADEAKRELEACGLPFSEDMAPLWEKKKLAGHTAPNRILFQPMEGCDGERDGRPGEATLRRYRRFARGGAGVIWGEACAVVPEGRANPRQLMLTEENLPDYQRLVEMMREEARKSWGGEPVILLQLTHSGRFSRPEPGPLKPLLGTHSKPLDDAWHVSYDQPLVTDEYLDSLIPAFARSARLAERAGFDGVDVKACHRYLASCLLSGFDRPGRYGGDYEGRTRLIRESFAAAAAAVSPGFIMASRLNYYDGIELPGWGCSPDDFHQVMLDEPLRLTRDLVKEGLCLVNVTMGSPYYNPYVNRPANRGAAHPEHPLAGVRRLVSGARAANSEVSAVATGLSWLRQYGPNLAAALVRDGWADFAGFGRMNFAYPDFPLDLRDKGAIEGEKCCVGCGLCTAMMRAGGSTGCPVRDKEYYLPQYRALCQKKEG